MKDKWSLNVFLPLLFLCSGFVLLAVYLGVSYGHQKSQFQQSSEQRLESLAPRLLFITQRLLGAGQGDVLDLEMQSMQGLQHVGLVVVVDRANKVLHSSDPDLRGAALESTELAWAAELIAASDGTADFVASPFDNQTQMVGVFSYSLPDDSNSSGHRVAGHIAISIKLEESYQELREGLWSQALIFSTLLAIVAGLLWYILRHVLIVPLRRIVDATRSIAAGDFTVRAGLESSNELGEISATLDSLAEASLQRADVQNSHRRLSQLVEEMVDEVFVNDCNTFETINSNRAAQQNLGYRADELAELKPWDFVKDHTHASMSERLKPLFDGSLSFFECESLHIRKDGSTYPVRARMQYMSHQSPPVLVTIAQDLSEQKIQEENAQLRDRALAEVTEGIIITDAGPDGRLIVYANQAICKLSGYSKEELVGRNVDMLRKGKMAQPALQNVREALGKGESVQVQLDATRKDGSDYVAEVSMSPLFNASGELTHFIGVHRDITQKLQAEKKLRQAQKIKAIGALSGGLAHDFNNLLSVIVGSLELIRANTDDEEQIARIEGAENAAYMGAHLTRRLLSFASQQQLTPVVTNVNEHIRNAMALLAPTIGETISLTEDLAADLWKTLADPGEIETAVINLTINARDAMAQGGTITIRTANVVLEENDTDQPLDAEPGEYVKLCVIDNGSGISNVVKDRMFEPFFTTKEDGEGSGLGLASVFGFAKQCGGSVYVSSAEGEGTVVSVFLPRHLQDDEASRKSSGEMLETSQCFRGKSILVVEDKDMVRELTVQQLEALGFKVQAVSNGSGAIELLENGLEVDVVLSDVIMPGGVCGYDVARWVQENRPRCRILLCSGFNHTADESGRPEVTDLHVLQKPYRLNDLSKALHDAMSQEGVEAAPAHPQ